MERDKRDKRDSDAGEDRDKRDNTLKGVTVSRSRA